MRRPLDRHRNVIKQLWFSCFLSGILPVLFLTHGRRRLWVILVGSYFSALVGLRLLPVQIVMTGINYYVGHFLEASQTTGGGCRLLALSVCVNLLVLVLFKYLGLLTSAAITLAQAAGLGMSSRIRRLRPFTHLWASKPQTPPRSVVLTDSPSMMTTEGHANGLTFLRVGSKIARCRQVHTGVLPRAEILIHTAPGWIFPGKKTPLTAGVQQIEIRIDHGTKYRLCAAGRRAVLQAKAERVVSRDNPEQFLRPQQSAEPLRQQAARHSDMEATTQMQFAKQKLFAAFRKSA